MKIQFTITAPKTRKQLPAVPSEERASSGEPRDTFTMGALLTGGSSLVAVGGSLTMLSTNEPTTVALSALAIVGGTLGAAAGIGIMGAS